MRPFLFALVLAGLSAPVVALADDQSAAPTPAMMQQREAAFAQIHQQMQRLHQQERAQMLASLSPAHKALLAQIAGDLAISPNPDFAAGARRLDAALTPAESQAVIRAHEAFKQQEHNAMEAAHAQFEKSLTPEEQQKVEQRHEKVAFGSHTEHQPDAGMLLLMPGHPMMWMAPHPPM
jgi:hypothetical protein